jgi:YVTN family beta-propeller protein
MIPGLGRFSAPGGLYGIAADETAVWVYNGESGNVVRIDPKTNHVVATIAVGIGCAPGILCGNIALGQGAVWVASGAAETVSRIDPQTNQVVAVIPFGSSVGVSPDAVWVADFNSNALSHIDPGTNGRVTTLFNQPGAGAVSFGAGSLWLCNVHGTENGLVRINPATNKVLAQLDVSLNDGLEGFQVVALDKEVWVEASDGTTTAIERIDPATNKVTISAPVPGKTWAGFAADEQGVWGLDVDVGLIRFNPQTGQVVGHLALTGGAGVAVGAGSVWVAKDDGTLLRITPAA